MRRRRAVSASNRTAKASSTVSACLSNPCVPNSGIRWSSERRSMAAAAVQVRSQDGWGLLSKHKILLVPSAIKTLFRGSKKQKNN